MMIRWSRALSDRSSPRVVTRGAFCVPADYERSEGNKSRAAQAAGLNCDKRCHVCTDGQLLDNPSGRSLSNFADRYRIKFSEGLSHGNEYRAGFRVVAFIHDEVLIELPVESDLTASALRVDRILCESMEQLTGSVPIACEYALSDRWYKAAEAVFDENGRLCLWSPKK
jgi:hypothetical protein